MRGEREGCRLAREGRGVVGARVGERLGGEPGAGLDEVAVGRAGRGEALLPLGSDVEQAGADRAAQPLLAGGGVERAAERAGVDGDRARALRAVEQHGHVDLGEGGRRRGAREPADVRAGDQLGVGSDRVGQVGERHLAHAYAAAGGGGERAVEAGVLLVAGEDLVAAAEVERGEDAHDALARRGRQRDVGGRGGDALRVCGAQAVEQLVVVLEVRAAGTAVRDEPVELAAGRVDRHARNRAARARVQVREAVEDGKGGAQLIWSHAPQVVRNRRPASSGDPSSPSAGPRGGPARPRARRRGRRCRPRPPSWRR